MTRDQKLLARAIELLTKSTNKKNKDEVVAWLEDDAAWSHEETESDMTVSEAKKRGDTFYVDLWYPRLAAEDGRVSKISIGLMDVRAADSIEISYDFERDGWKIEQASIFEWEADDKVCDPGLIEVAFIPAWGQQKIPPPDQHE